MREEIIIRQEKEEDYYDVEYLAKRAFWNLHRPGCDEHYLVHMLRKSEDYIPELSRVAEIDGKIVGVIMYSKAYILDREEKIDIITFGPLCVDPEYQNQGIGGALLEETMQLAREAGYRGIVIFGEPGYYPKHGFKTCDNFNITTSEGENSNPFMGIELQEDGFKDIQGKFYEPEIYDNLNPKEVDDFDEGFPHMEKLKLPGQWQ